MFLHSTCNIYWIVDALTSLQFGQNQVKYLQTLHILVVYKEVSCLVKMRKNKMEVKMMMMSNWTALLFVHTFPGHVAALPSTSSQFHDVAHPLYYLRWILLITLLSPSGQWAALPQVGWSIIPVTSYLWDWNCRLCLVHTDFAGISLDVSRCDVVKPSSPLKSFQ